jgi:hypothetical protein
LLFWPDDREGSRPRDPLFARTTPAREDARPPGGFHSFHGSHRQSASQIFLQEGGEDQSG